MKTIYERYNKIAYSIFGYESPLKFAFERYILTVDSLYKLLVLCKITGIHKYVFYLLISLYILL